KRGAIMATERLPGLFRRLNARNREKVALASLGIRRSADIFEAAERQFEEARLCKAPVQARTADASKLAGMGIRTLAEN
ncbi:hypothetical protein IL306_007184, partial [Fusarium sp. DS 682]